MEDKVYLRWLCLFWWRRTGAFLDYYVHFWIYWWWRTRALSDDYVYFWFYWDDYVYLMMENKSLSRLLCLFWIYLVTENKGLCWWLCLLRFIFGRLCLFDDGKHWADFDDVTILFMINFIWDLWLFMTWPN